MVARGSGSTIADARNTEFFMAGLRDGFNGLTKNRSKRRSWRVSGLPVRVGGGSRGEALQIPTLVAFYMSGAGVVAHARLTGAREQTRLT